MRSTLFGGVLLAAAAMPLTASAQAPVAAQAPGDGDWARRYARGTVSLLSQGDLLVGVPISGFVAGGGLGGGTVGFFALGATVRITINHFLIEPHLSFGTGFFGSGLSSNFSFRPGIGVGAAIPITPRFALSPMGRASFIIPTGGSQAYMVFTGMLPFTIFLGRNGFFEPYVELGALAFDSGTAAGGFRGNFVFGIGYRLGVVF